MDYPHAPAGGTDLLAVFEIGDAPVQAAPARSSDPQLAHLTEAGGAVFARRHHGITVGLAHYEVRAARAAAAAHRRGMSHEDIAAAMGLPVAEIQGWLTARAD